MPSARNKAFTSTLTTPGSFDSAQLVSGGTEYYAYTADSKRIFKKTPAAGSTFTEEWTMYGARGEKLGSFTMPCAAGGSCNNQPVLNPTISFAGGTIWDKGAEVRADRLGTNRANGAKFYPYGEEITSTTNDRAKFGTYTRDGFTGLDYADQRFYASSYGRFNTADPYRASAGATDPGSWNRYSYVGGDPINYRDSKGLNKEAIDIVSCLSNTWFSEVCFDSPEVGGGGGGGGGGGSGGAEQRGGGSNKGTTFEIAQATFGEAARTIAGKKTFKQKCNDDFGSLGTTAAAVLNGAANVVFLNAVGSDVSRASLYSTSPVDGVRQAQTLQGLLESLSIINPVRSQWRHWVALRSI